MADLQSRIQKSLSGTYTIERELGGGGMSRVFVADEVQLGRKVVVKVLSPELAASISTSRFEREIRVAASLQQANIVPVFAAGDLDGLPYYTMPFVEGESLRARLARGPLAIGECVGILRDVSRALAYAHERGVVHRDIKPDNVLLSGHTAVVTDFGIAKAIAAAAAGPSGATLTQLGTAVGTPAYMAPEQAAGDPDTDHRADIYAFGCLAYELLSGQQPFAGLPPHKLLVAHMSEMPVPVADRRTDCPPALAALVMQCLGKTAQSRPASAAELLHRLDVVISPSASQAAMPGIMLGGRHMLRRALAAYAVAFVAVAILARAAIVSIGLPDWVFPGALVVMALGLPVILFAGYAQYVTRRAASATPTFTPGGTPTMAPVNGTMAMLAVKASPHISWSRISRGGVAAIGAFVLLVGGFMGMRSMGIGPAGSLLASGKLQTNDKVLVTTFDTPGADTSLGSTIAAAVRTDLSQSRVVRIIPASTIANVLEQMQRPDTARIDLATAREIAQRAGAKAIVTGSVVPAGTGFLVTARLVVAESGDELVSYSEAAEGVPDLISSVDRLTRALRGKIGESLKTVRESPPLEQVTTASLGALRSYATAMHISDVRGDFEGALPHFREAIRQDSTFAMAYLQLAYTLQNLGGRVRFAQADTAIMTAFQLRDRLPERERYNIEGAYYIDVAPDRKKALIALRRAVALDSGSSDAANTLGFVLNTTGEYAAADSAYRLALVTTPENAIVLGNLVGNNLNMGRYSTADSLITVVERMNQEFPIGLQRVRSFWGQGKYDAADSVARVLAEAGPPNRQAFARDALTSLTAMRGKLKESEQWYRRFGEARLRAGFDTLTRVDDAVRNAMTDFEVRGNAARAKATLDAARRWQEAQPLSLADDRSLALALAFATVGDAQAARDLLNRFEARLSASERSERRPQLFRIRGMMAVAEKKADSALQWFRQADIGDDGLPNRNCSACSLLFAALAFEVGQQPDSARRYYLDYLNDVNGRGFTDRYYMPRVLFRLGELHADAGDVAGATEYYGRLVDLWSNADAELQPRVAEARARIDRLNRARR